MSKIIELTDENFKTQLDNTDKPVLVDFYAPWCGYCQRQMPIVKELANEMEGIAEVATLNIDKNETTAADYFISGIPAILIFKNGKLMEQMSGLQQKAPLKKALEKYSNNN